MGFSRQEYCSGLPFPSAGDFPHPGIEPSLPHYRQILYHLSNQSHLVGKETQRFTACGAVGRQSFQTLLVVVKTGRPLLPHCSTDDSLSTSNHLLIYPQTQQFSFKEPVQIRYKLAGVLNDKYTGYSLQHCLQ